MKKFLFLIVLGVFWVSNNACLAADGFYVIGGFSNVGTKITSLSYTINSPGFYYLASNLNYNRTDGSAITINASNVTLDLMGFCLTGRGKTAGSSNGISINNGCTNVEIRNGSINAFANDGINTAYDAVTNIVGTRIIGLRIQNVGGYGIILYGPNNLIMSCFATSAVSGGIFAGKYSLVKGNHVATAIGGGGIYVDEGSNVTGNTVSGALWYGIYCVSGSSVTDNTCCDNQESGIAATNNCTIMRNTVYNNQGKGIYASNYCSITNNAGNSGMTYGSNCVLENNAIQP
jgi:hypothetical protein